MLERFNSLSVEKFTVDGENVLTKFLEHYTKNFAKGFASSKLAGVALAGSTAVLAEIELPIAAISALISEGFEYFNTLGVTDDFKPGDVCLFNNGYWPVTPEEEASLAMSQVDDTFEPLAMVPRYDIVIVQDKLDDGRYEVFDFAKQETKKVAAKYLRHETDNKISQYPIVQKLKEKFSSYVKPFFLPTTKFAIGDYVFLRGLEGTDDCDGKIEHITSEFLNIETVDLKYITVLRKDWVKLLSPADLETLKTDNHIHFHVQQIMLYKETIKLRPCIIIQTKPDLLIRLFHLRMYVKVNPSELVKPTHEFKTKLFQTREYRRIIEMVMKTPFDFSDRIPVVTDDVSLNAFADPRAPPKSVLTKPIAITANVEGEEIMEVIPASIETRRYGTVAPGEATPAEVLDRQWPGGGSPGWAANLTQGQVLDTGLDKSRFIPPAFPLTAYPTYPGLDKSRFIPQAYPQRLYTQHPGITTINEPIPAEYFGASDKGGDNTVMLLGVAAVLGLGIFIMNK